jgi:hypothetical protein
MFSTVSPRKQAAFGVIAIGAAVALSSFGIVRAQLANPDKADVYRCSSGTACVEAHSTGPSTYAVLGISPSDGVHGETRSESGKAGVTGFSRGISGIANGVFGKSSNGDGVVGAAVHSKSGVGVVGFSEKGDGVIAESKGANAVALRSHAANESAAIFVGENPSNRAHCVIDPHANLECTGSITGDAAIQSVHRNADGQRVLAYAPESAAATIEDVGTARMNGGVANVRLDPGFAAMMDRRWYYVFLTPLGDTRGLYVSLKTVSGFQVRESERGRSNLDFDYRIVAHPIDAGNDRLPDAPLEYTDGSSWTP